jgi:uncharacterized protein YndB with AHSA1/START domain
MKEHDMTSNSRAEASITGSLRVEDGKGAVRMEARLDAGADHVWSALTDPVRLASWYGEVEGDFRVGGEYRAHLFASGWEGTGRIEECEAGRRLVVTGAEPGRDGTVSEVTLSTEGGQTFLVWEERGMQVDWVAAYGAGVQIHVEDLAAHLAGRERGDAEARWAELQPAYDELAAKIG